MQDSILREREATGTVHGNGSHLIINYPITLPFHMQRNDLTKLNDEEKLDIDVG